MWKLSMQKIAIVFVVLAVAELTVGQQTRPTTRKRQDAKVKVTMKEVNLKSLDGLTLTADVYVGSQNNNMSPVILLCHQAGWSRGEYGEIAPRLVKMGFNCVALDQRSGGGVNGVANKSVAAAKKKKLPTLYLDARQDIIAAAKHLRTAHPKSKILLWGSSYSAALVLEIVGNNPNLADGVLSFAPGEYFGRFGKTDHYVRDGAKKIRVPLFLTGAKSETQSSVKTIADSLKLGKNLHFFKPTTQGHHGSRALWAKFDDSPAYWKAVTKFLDAHFPRKKATSKPSMKSKK